MCSYKKKCSRKWRDQKILFHITRNSLKTMFVKIRVYIITNLFNTSLIFTSKVYQTYINCTSAYQLAPYGKPKFFPSEVCEYWEDRRLCLLHPHSVKSVQIRSFFWSVFSRIWKVSLRISSYSVQIREKANEKKRIWTLFTQYLSARLTWVKEGRWRLCRARAVLRNTCHSMRIDLENDSVKFQGN